MYEKKKRGILAKAFFVIELGFYPLLVLTGLLLHQRSLFSPDIEHLIILTRIIAASALWRWKRWGVYGMILVHTLRLYWLVETGHPNSVAAFFSLLPGELAYWVFLFFVFKSLWQQLE